jgi:uncharacterized protein
MENDLNKGQIIKKLSDNFAEMEGKYNVKRIGIFGSFAREENDLKSDIDILVEFESPVGFFLLIDLENYLYNLLGRKVDLTTKNSLKPVVRDRILNETIYAE